MRLNDKGVTFRRVTTSAVAGLLAASVFAAAGEARAANPDCRAPTKMGTSTALGGTVVIYAGSSAAKPMLKSVSPLLAGLSSNAVRLVYISLGSCAGLSDVTTQTKEKSAGVYWDETNGGAELPCDPTAGGDALGEIPDVAISDVFPTTCNNITVPAGQANFNGSAEIMNFIVPPSSSQNVISYEAALVVFGWGGVTNTVAPWTDVTNMFIRDPNKSGTYSELISLIGIPGSKLKGTIPGAGKSPDILTAVHNADASAPNAAIGAISSDYADANRSGSSAVKILAFQPKGAACGVYPDSKGGAAGTLDKYNVRSGFYPFWGPVHYVTKVDGSGNPTIAGAGTAMQYLTRKGLTDSAALKSMIDYEVAAYTIPQCAMNVQRTAEVAPVDTGLVKYTPGVDGNTTDPPCHCYYEFKQTGATGISGGIEASCTSCTDDTACSGSTPKCRYGYCEAR